MGAIQDRTMEHLCATDAGIIMTRKLMLRAAKAAAEGKPVPATEPAAQRVRSVAIELGQGVSFSEGAKHGLYAEPGTEPMSV
jgi:hypothetical protein